MKTFAIFLLSKETFTIRTCSILESFFRKLLSKATFERKLSSVSLPLRSRCMKLFIHCELNAYTVTLLSLQPAFRLKLSWPILQTTAMAYQLLAGTNARATYCQNRHPWNRHQLSLTNCSRLQRRTVSFYFPAVGARSIAMSMSVRLLHSSLGPPESSSQTASRSVQPLLQGSRSLQADRQTDKPRYFVCSNRPHL